MVSDKQLKNICEDRYYYKDGALYNKAELSTRATKDKKAGGVATCGYLTITIDGKKYLAHRLVFLMHHGYLPRLLDHINRNKLDNRIENLREASFKLNVINSKTGKNNTSGRKGVSWNARRQNYRAYIKNDTKLMHLGSFDNIIDAVIARMKAEEMYHHDVK
tara:strand:- start:203 stop:688 length:486 start_codon:yes stop_codon:yes gene_type:complete